MPAQARTTAGQERAWEPAEAQCWAPEWAQARVTARAQEPVLGRERVLPRAQAQGRAQVQVRARV